jgi:peptide/nickel transport system substrate-binding protein
VTTNPEHLALTNAASNGESQVNQEWQLADIVDAIAAEIDRAEDTLSLKSYARGKSISLNQLSLDLEVTVRRDVDGRILFRTVEPNQTSATVLKLDFAQVLENQLRGVRKQLDKPADQRPLAILPEIKVEEIKALNVIAIYSIDDLERYTQTAAMLAEVSRKTGIDDSRIRKWRQLPYCTEVKPNIGSPGTTVVIEGGNFGSERGNAQILFQGQPAIIQDWSESRLRVKMPLAAKGSGVLFVVIDGQMTNTLAWQAATVHLVVRDITINPAAPVTGDAIALKADLINQGGDASGSFKVQWVIDGKPQPSLLHGTLQPGQQSQESCINLELNNLSPGKHIVRFTADPENKIPDINSANSTFTKEFVINSFQQLTIGHYSPIVSLDPIANTSLPEQVYSLIFRYLVRRDPKTGKLVPDIAKSWTTRIIDMPDTSIRKLPPIDDNPGPRPPINRQPIITFELRDDVLFHNGMTLTADDVAFSYQLANSKRESRWNGWMATFAGIQVLDKTTISFYLKENMSLGNMDYWSLWSIPILPRRLYEADAQSFVSKPIGSGPFQVKSFVPGKEIQLSAFQNYVYGAPRISQIKMPIMPIDQLINAVMAEQVDAAGLVPYSKDLHTRLSSTGKWNLIPVPENQPAVLYVQSKRLYECLPNSFDINWNAHLWYIQK